MTSLISLILSVSVSNTTQKKGCEYKFYTEVRLLLFIVFLCRLLTCLQFQSHEPEFDYLKSLEIEEKINRIRWCKRQNAAHFLLSTNGEQRFWTPHHGD